MSEAFFLLRYDVPCLAAPTGFEPVIFCMKSRYPRPLDDGAVSKTSYQKNGRLSIGRPAVFFLSLSLILIFPIAVLITIGIAVALIFFLLLFSLQLSGLFFDFNLYF